MQLKIHLISHPITQSLSSTVKDQKPPIFIKNQALKQLGLLMTYETIRNWLKVYKITIQQKEQKKEIALIDPKESCIIIFNSLKHLTFVHYMQEIIPKNNLKLIKKNEIDSSNNSAIELPFIDSHTKIIITASQLDSSYILNLLEYLTKYHKVKLSQIRLTCITCKIDQLINFKGKYSNLHIYTTKIT